MDDAEQRQQVRAAWVGAAELEAQGRAPAGTAFIQIREGGSIGLGFPEGDGAKLGPDCWRSVSCYAGTNRPDGYLTVSGAGEVRVAGQPLAEVRDEGVLLWVAQTVPVFLLTGKRAPTPY